MGAPKIPTVDGESSSLFCAAVTRPRNFGWSPIADKLRRRFGVRAELSFSGRNASSFHGEGFDDNDMEEKEGPPAHFALTQRQLTAPSAQATARTGQRAPQTDNADVGTLSTTQLLDLFDDGGSSGDSSKKGDGDDFVLRR